MVGFEYILRVWLNFSTTVPLGRYLMGRTLQDAPQSINIYTSFPPIFIVARILFEWLSTALIPSTEQDTEKISSSLSSKSNWFTECLCGDFLFLGSFVLCDFFFWEHFKAKWFSFWQAEQIFPKAGHFDLSFLCVWPAIFYKVWFIRAFGRLFDKIHLRRWGCVWILRWHSFQLSRSGFGAAAHIYTLFKGKFRYLE